LFFFGPISLVAARARDGRHVDDRGSGGTLAAPSCRGARRIKDGTLHAVRIGGRFRTTWADVWACESGVRPSGALAARHRTPLLAKDDLAQAMRVSVRTIERWMQDGLPTRSVGGNVRFNRSEATLWIRARFGIDVGELLDVAGPAAA
jgi:hypothetical protein